MPAPHFVSFVRLSTVLLSTQIPKSEVDLQLLQDAAIKENDKKGVEPQVT